MNATEITPVLLTEIEKAIGVGTIFIECNNFSQDWREAEKNEARLMAGDGHEEEAISFAVELICQSAFNPRNTNVVLFAYVYWERERMNTFLSFIQVGDKVKFVFNNTTGTKALKRCGFCLETLTGVIERGPRTYKFLLLSEVYPEYGKDKMVQRKR